MSTIKQLGCQLIVFGVALGFHSPSTAAPIDSFQTSSAVPVFGPGSGSAGPTTGAGIFGSRTLTNVLPASSDASATMVTNIAGGSASFSSSLTAPVGTTSTLAYTFPSAQNLLNAAGVTLGVQGVGMGDTPNVTLFVTNNGVETDRGTTNFTSAGLLNLPFNGLSDSVTGIRLRFDLDAGDAFTLNNTQGQGGVQVQFAPALSDPIAPEPATLATFGLMAAAGGAAARRKLKAGPVGNA